MVVRTRGAVSPPTEAAVEPTTFLINHFINHLPVNCCERAWASVYVGC